MRLVFIPAHNEARTLPAVLQHVGLQTDADILVLDDGSGDGTAEVARAFGPRVHLVRHHARQGYGGAMMTGFRWAADGGYEVVVTLDADLQHDPSEIPNFFAVAERCDVASGTRYHADSKVVQDAPPDRRHINEVVTDRIRCITGYPLTDSFCGYKAYRVEALKRLTLTEAGPAFPIEFWIQAWHAGLSVVEVPTARIYLDVERSFGGNLDDASTRLAYYQSVLDASLRAVGRPPLRASLAG